MPRPDDETLRRLPLSRRVPGPACSLLIAAACLALSLWIGWQHPLMELTCAPRAVQPPMQADGQRLITDGAIVTRLWGLVTIGHADLRNISHFTLRTTPLRRETLHAMTHDGSREIFADSKPGLLQEVTRLNSRLDSSTGASLTLRRTDWKWFSASWVLLLLGSLVLLRNVVIAPWRRRRRR